MKVYFKSVNIVIFWNKETIVPLVTPILGQYGLKPPDLLIKLCSQIKNTYPEFAEYINMEQTFLEPTALISTLDMALTVSITFAPEEIKIVSLRSPSFNFMYNFYYDNHEHDQLFFYKCLFVKINSSNINNDLFKSMYKSLLSSTILIAFYSY